MGLLERLFNIARAGIKDKTHKLRNDLDLDAKFSAYTQWWEEKHAQSDQRQQRTDEYSRQRASGSAYQQSRDANSNYPKQVIDDLSVFKLRPPSSLDQVKKARNQEIKKYHSDKFMNDPEKLKTSKEIMQIYNAAYDRLKTYYASKGQKV